MPEGDLPNCPMVKPTRSGREAHPQVTPSGPMLASESHFISGNRTQWSYGRRIRREDSGSKLLSPYCCDFSVWGGIFKESNRLIYARGSLHLESDDFLKVCSLGAVRVVSESGSEKTERPECIGLLLSGLKQLNLSGYGLSIGSRLYEPTGRTLENLDLQTGGRRRCSPHS